MALPIIKIKNVSNSTQTISGIRLLVNEDIEVEVFDRVALSANSSFTQAVNDGYIEVLYDGVALSAETGLGAMRRDVFVKIEGQNLGYSHTIDFSGIEGLVVGDSYGGITEVIVSDALSIENVENLQLILDGYQTITNHDVDIAVILNNLDGYLSSALLDGYAHQSDLNALGDNVTDIQNSLDGYDAGAILIWGSQTLTGGAITKYLVPGYEHGNALAEPLQYRMPRAGTFRNMRIRHNQPTASNTMTYTLRINDISTALSVSMSTSDSDGSDLFNTISVSAGDLVDIQAEKSGGGAFQGQIVVSLEIG